MNNILKRICAFLIVFSIAIVGMTQPASAGNLLPRSTKLAKVVIKKSPKLAKFAVKYAPKALKFTAKASPLGLIIDVGSMAYDVYDYETNNERNTEKQQSKNNWN